MHLQRIITALIAIPILYIYVTKLPAQYFLILLSVVSVLAQIEFYRMYRTKPIFSILGLICGLAILLHPLLIPQVNNLPNSPFPSSLYLYICIIFIMSISTLRLFVLKNPTDALRDISAPVIGVLYIPTLLLLQWFLRLEGLHWILFLYASVWISDTFAYYIGKNFGKKKLYITVSPNKTVEGAIASVLGGGLSGILMNIFFFKDVNIYTLFLFGLIIGGVSIIGDLVESMFKRDSNIKDSGSLIPGHGGFLDRIDSALFAGGILYILVILH
ncbi:MAG: phosphatidate cytidylyltransferase [Thermodesulfovibrionales bacterium]|nr:phosphatidate cytidylyltransferase [Thermodesulfovibrionales bacterium]